MKIAQLIICLIGLLSVRNVSTAQHKSIKSFHYKSGDLIFQNLDCGAMCDAIEAVTTGVSNQSFSHMGLVYKQNNSLMVIEAVGVGVRSIALDSFLSRSAHPHYIGRLKKRHNKLNRKAIKFAQLQLGKPYDDAFTYGDEKYYCSELIYDAYKFANKNVPFFQLEPMTFKEPNSNTFFPVWITYYQALNKPIPEGAPGCNPGGMSRSPKIEIVHITK